MKNLKIILRSILRQRLNSGIIVISLAIGIACFNMIIMFISRELRTDTFHNKADQIYALKCDDPWVPGGKMYHCRIGSAEYMKKNFAQVEDFCRINAAGSQKILVNEEEYFDKPKIISTSSNFFDFFSYRLLTNNPETALEAANNIVISQDLAIKYFGSVDPLGKIITFFNRDKEEQMVVTGIFEKPVDNTQIEFDMVRLIGESDSRCYVRLTKMAYPAELEKLFKDKKETIPSIYSGTPGAYYLKPLKEVYFDRGRNTSFEAGRDKTDLWIALIIGLMIIGIASFNYLGLLANNLIEKTKEYNIRRINGGSTSSFILDFMVENLIIIAVSFILSLLLMQEMVPFFNEMTGSNITERFILQGSQISFLPGIVFILLFMTFLFVLYRIQSDLNTMSLKPGQEKSFSSVHFPVFNILQLASSVALIICSIIIIKQMSFITNKPIGLDKEVIEVKLPATYADKAELFKAELIKNSSIDKVSVVGTSPLLEHFVLLIDYKENGVEKQYAPAGFSGDENYIKTLGLTLVKGSAFSENIASNKGKCLINESFAKLFTGEDLIGKNTPGMDDKVVVGIVKDFHYSSLKSYVEPAFISFDNKGSHLMVKGAENQAIQTRETIAGVWKKLIPDYPVNIESIGDRYEWFHRNNKNYIRLIGACSLISLFLSMIGLFAISYQTSRYRTKEIGIRKINGARIYEILAMLNNNFAKWVGIACIIAFPAAWYAMHKWLNNFAYKTEFKWWVLVLAGMTALIITLLTVSWQSWRAATRNPVEALRYE
ncbi:MAG TPA: ABC transporter permease [Bacteroidales bacterium]|nr:ABC transporter permease [Bacteroidales bacterium]